MTVGLDANFGSNGIVTAPESVSASSLDVAVHSVSADCCHSSHLTHAPDGGFFAFFNVPASGTRIEIRRYDANGNWDQSFNDSEWWLNGSISVTSRVIAGDSGQMFLVSNQGIGIEIRKMLSNGAFDQGFGTRGLVQIDFPTPYRATARMAVGIDAENGFVIAVSAAKGRDSESLLIGVNSNGELDMNFGTGGYLFLGMSRFDDSVNALSIA